MDSMPIIQALTLIVIGLGVVVGWAQLRLLRKQIKAQHDWNRRLTSLQYSFSSDPHIREIRTRLDQHLNIPNQKTREIHLEEIEALATQQYPEVMTDIQFILGRLESMCVAIKNGIVDERTCKDMLRGIVIEYFRFFRQYIESKRDIRNNPRLYVCLETYAQRWDKAGDPSRPKVDESI
ncbi:hypothetical protein LCGC14_0204130 [marine sediment metagenome]|uniref:DUF4760 domain-containing protein n=1 Tax=marine sediment metagenome TaxID=412755 RepID=A0A0F9UI31_9ZZZZ|nr:DUF4760 domain-containing protein [Phycisphaerae bacterium]HDZ43444.1 DUF4760 domain-containing protein [Phycisphaerae bacterium]